MTDHVALATLTSEMSVDRSLVKDWEHIKIGTWDNIRIYYKPMEDGYMFYVLDFASCSSQPADASVYDAPDCEVVIMFAGYGFFDGVRHLYCHKDGDGFDGYIYYPKVEAMVEIFSRLRELELKYCWDADKGY